jgi:serine/threonine protein kinase
VTGEEAYSAPELSSGSSYDERVDVWSAGVVMYQLMTNGKKLKIFSYDEPDIIQSQVAKRIRKARKLGRYSDDAFEVLERLLTVCPQSRPFAHEPLTMSWFLQDSI